MVRGRIELPPSSDGGDFDEYYRSDNKRLASFVLKLGANLQEAEDAAQEAMEEIFTRWERIGSQNPAAYARTVAEHKFFRSRARFKQTRHKVSQVEWAAERAIKDVHPGLLKDEAQYLIEIMQELPYEQRRVLAWRADGFKDQEIADAIEKPVSTVRSNLRHARATVLSKMAARKAASTSATGTKEARQ